MADISGSCHEQHCGKWCDYLRAETSELYRAVFVSVFLVVPKAFLWKYRSKVSSQVSQMNLCTR